MNLLEQAVAAPSSFATPAPVQSKTGSSTGPAAASFTFTATPTVGYVICVMFASRTGAGVSQANHAPSVSAWSAGTTYTTGQIVSNGGAYWQAISGSTGVTPGTDTSKWDVAWVKAAGQGRGTGSPQMSAWYKVVRASEPSAVAFLDPGSTGSCTIAGIEISGINTVSPLDKTYTLDGGSGTVVTLAMGPTPQMTTSKPFLLAGVAASNTVTFLDESHGGWTNGFVQQTVQTMLATASLVGSSPSTYSTTETWTTARTCVGIICGFRAAPV